MIVNDVDDDQLKEVNGSAEENLDHSQKVYLVKEIGPPPEDPVCDSGIYCYGKTFFYLWIYCDVKKSFLLWRHMNFDIVKFLLFDDVIWIH